jgi:peptide deformylase
MIKEVLKIGDPRLLEISKPVEPSEFKSQALNELITDMTDTMRHEGGVGISAVQIGVHKRIALIEYDNDNPRYEDTGRRPLTVIINPTLEFVDDEMSEYNEGCLSVPDERATITRPKRVKYSFYNADGQLTTGEDDTFFVRVLQHEVDHLNGILFPMWVG